MSRLTKEEVKECATSVVASNIGRGCGKTLTGRILSELLEYKYIEEELGIDLITLFKALKNGVYYKHDYYGIVHKQVSYIGKKRLVHQYYSLSDFDEEDIKFEYYDYNDYGKTWALTREELKGHE